MKSETMMPEPLFLGFIIAVPLRLFGRHLLEKYFRCGRKSLFYPKLLLLDIECLQGCSLPFSVGTLALLKKPNRIIFISRLDHIFMLKA